MQFAEKESFHHIVQIIWEKPWTEPITCTNFSLETGL